MWLFALWKVKGSPSADLFKVNRKVGGMSDTNEELMAKLTINQNRLQSYIFTLTADREAARDVLQATNLVIWRKAQDFVPGSNFIAWAFQIARYQVLAHRQKNARDRLRFSDEFVNELAEKMDSKASDEYIQDRQAALTHCLKKVPDNQRAVIWLRYRDGLQNHEIAEQIEKSVSVVEQMIHRLRIALLQCITQRLKEEVAR